MVNMKRTSFNINGQNVERWNQLLEWGKRVKPPFTLVMDNKQKAREWLTHVGGEMVYRVWDVADNYYHKSISPIQAAEQMAREHQDIKDMWQYYRLNEPGGAWAELQDWIIAFAEAARVRGFKVTSLGLAIMKNWDNPEWVQQGHVDKLIRYAYEHQDTFLLDVHEYVTGFAWSGHTPNYPANLFDWIASTNGETTAKIDWTTYTPALQNWFLGRVSWVANVRARELVGDVIPFIITECWFDWHAAAHQQFVTLGNGQRVRVEDELKARYGDNRTNRDIRGVLGSRRLFEWLATGDNNANPDDNRFADVIIRNFQWCEANYPENCKGIMLFTANGNWRYPHGHDYQPVFDYLLPKMESMVVTIPPVPEPTPEPLPEVIMIPQQIKVRNTAVRIRTLPTIINSALVTWFTATEWTDVLLSEVPVKVADGYIWYRIEWGIYQGYIAQEDIVNGVTLIDIYEEVETPVFAVTPTEQALIEHIRNGDWFDAVTLLQHLWSDSL